MIPDLAEEESKVLFCVAIPTICANIIQKLETIPDMADDMDVEFKTGLPPIFLDEPEFVEGRSVRFFTLVITFLRLFVLIILFRNLKQFPIWLMTIWT